VAPGRIVGLGPNVVMVTGDEMIGGEGLGSVIEDGAILEYGGMHYRRRWHHSRRGWDGLWSGR